MTLGLNNISISHNTELLVNSSAVFSDGLNVIIGRSGIGKSTLLRAILGFHRLDSGKITFIHNAFNSSNIIDIRKHIAWIPQDLKNYVDGTLDNFVHSLNLKRNIFNASLNHFNMSFENKNIESYSTGELQRIFLAIAMTQNCNILLADEPTSALDNVNKSLAIDFLLKSNLCICISHDSDVIDASNHIFEIKNGSLVDYVRNH